MSKAMFAQVCSATGKGINVGWKVWDEWFSTQELADEYCLRTEGKTFIQLYEEAGEHQDDLYYTEFDEGDIDSMNYYADGTPIEFD
jgi:hypothetical protein